MTVTIILETNNKSISSPEEDSQDAVETSGDDVVRQSQTIILYERSI